MTSPRLRSILLGAAICLAASVLLFGQAQPIHPVSGRVIAGVMGHEGAPWLDRPERESEERPTRAVQELKLEPGMVVADFGAGSGYYTERLARAVGPTGRVLAVDLQPEMLQLVGKRATRLGLTNIELVRSMPDDPHLPAGVVDLILMVDVYHEFSHPFEMAEKLIAALKPGGRLVFVEFRLEDPKVPIKLVHKMSERQVLREMEAFPELEHTRTVGSLPWQHVIIFTKKEPKK
jgi:ubiquinone/menaquinone biosynthesis C-methylase UbiE